MENLENHPLIKLSPKALSNRLKEIKPHEKKDAMSEFNTIIDGLNDISKDKTENNFSDALEVFLKIKSETKILALILYFKENKHCVFKKKFKFCDCIEAILEKLAPNSSFTLTKKCHDFIVKSSNGKRVAVNTAK